MHYHYSKTVRSSWGNWNSWEVDTLLNFTQSLTFGCDGCHTPEPADHPLLQRAKQSQYVLDAHQQHNAIEHMASASVPSPNPSVCWLASRFCICEKRFNPRDPWEMKIKWSQARSRVDFSFIYLECIMKLICVLYFLFGFSLSQSYHHCTYFWNKNKNYKWTMALQEIEIVPVRAWTAVESSLSIKKNKLLTV